MKLKKRALAFLCWAAFWSVFYFFISSDKSIVGALVGILVQSVVFTFVFPLIFIPLKKVFKNIH